MPGPTGAADEAYSQAATSLAAFSFANAFPTGYGGSPTVDIVPGWPPDQWKNLEVLNKGRLSVPIISLVCTPYVEEARTMSDLWMRPGAGAGVISLAERVTVRFLVTCWADQLMGGELTAKRLGGLVQAWALITKNTLGSYRRLRTQGGHCEYDDASMLWYYLLSLEGQLLLSADLP